MTDGLFVVPEWYPRANRAGDEAAVWARLGPDSGATRARLGRDSSATAQMFDRTEHTRAVPTASVAAPCPAAVRYTRGHDDRSRLQARPSRFKHASQAARLQRHPAKRDHPPGQRPGRDPQLRRSPEPRSGRGLRDDLLHRRLPRPHQQPRSRGPASPHARDGGLADRPRPGPEEVHALRAVGSAGGHRAVLAVQHRHAGRVAPAHAHLQGEAPEPARGRQPRPAHLPRAAGRRHRPVQGLAGAGRQGPGRASGAEPRDRARLQRPLRRDVSRAAGRLHRGTRRAWHGRRQRR